MLNSWRLDSIWKQARHALQEEKLAKVAIDATLECWYIIISRDIEYVNVLVQVLADTYMLHFYLNPRCSDLLRRDIMDPRHTHMNLRLNDLLSSNKTQF